jgi:hypothetical protein
MSSDVADKTKHCLTKYAKPLESLADSVEDRRQCHQAKIHTDK